MNIHHRELLQMVQAAPNKDFGFFDLAHYLGTPHTVYGIDTPTRKDIVRKWKNEHHDLSYEAYLKLTISLNRGYSFEEKLLSSSVLGSFPTYLKQIDPMFLDGLLEHLTGWAEIDSLCQSTFGADEMLAQWDKWKKVLQQFNQSSWISKRRASLVLLTKPCRQSNDKRLSILAFQNTTNLMHEKDILITKAISWLLRALIKHHKDEVSQYLKENESRLPKIAVREVRRKIETGKK